MKCTRDSIRRHKRSKNIELFFFPARRDEIYENIADKNCQRVDNFSCRELEELGRRDQYKINVETLG